MSDNTKIEWADATWNPITGCSVISSGCTNCYAMKLAGGRLRNHPSRKGLTRPTNSGPVWTGEVRFNESVLDQPLRWGRPRRIFVCAHGDLFHDHVPSTWIDRVFAVMRAAPQHQFLVLTKRAGRMDEYCWPYAYLDSWPLPNLWLGVSVEDQGEAHERIQPLLCTPAAVRWLSAEPLLGPLDLTRVLHNNVNYANVLNCVANNGERLCSSQRPLDWVVIGGESGPGARPCDLVQVARIIEDCREFGVPVFVKQLGKQPGFRHPKGGDPAEWPPHLRVRQFPAPLALPTARNGGAQ